MRAADPPWKRQCTSHERLAHRFPDALLLLVQTRPGPSPSASENVGGTDLGEQLRSALPLPQTSMQAYFMSAASVVTLRLLPWAQAKNLRFPRLLPTRLPRSPCLFHLSPWATSRCSAVTQDRIATCLGFCPCFSSYCSPVRPDTAPWIISSRNLISVHCFAQNIFIASLRLANLTTSLSIEPQPISAGLSTSPTGAFRSHSRFQTRCP